VPLLITLSNRVITCRAGSSQEACNGSGASFNARLSHLQSENLVSIKVDSVAQRRGHKDAVPSVHAVLYHVLQVHEQIAAQGGVACERLAFGSLRERASAPSYTNFTKRDAEPDRVEPACCHSRTSTSAENVWTFFCLLEVRLKSKSYRVNGVIRAKHLQNLCNHFLPNLRMFHGCVIVCMTRALQLIWSELSPHASERIAFVLAKV